MPSKAKRRAMGLQRKAFQKRRMQRLHAFANMHRVWVRSENQQRYYNRHKRTLHNAVVKRAAKSVSKAMRTKTRLIRKRN